MPEEKKSYFTQVEYPSNSPFAASEIPGWLYLTEGDIHLFLTVRDKEEYGKRYFIATLSPGDWFPRIPFFDLADGTGCEYGYLLVPQTSSVCQIISAENFAMLMRENSTGDFAIAKRLITMLSSAYCGEEEELLRCADIMTLPETLFEITRRNWNAITLREREEEANAVAERLHQKGKLQEQFHQLREIVNPRKSGSPYTKTDPLLAALHVIAEKYNLSIAFEPELTESSDPESRLIAFCQENQWRIRRIQLERGFSRLHHKELIGFYGTEVRPCILKLKGADSVWYCPGEEEMHPLTLRQETELQNFAYCFYESFPLHPLTGRDLMHFLCKGGRKLFCCIFAVGGLVGIFGLVMPVATAYVTGKIIPTANTGELWQLLILLLTLTLGTVILNIVPQLCLLLFESMTMERLMAAFFDRVFRLPVTFFQKYSAGELCTRLFAILRIQELVFQAISQQFLSSIFALCSIVMLFYYSWRLTLIAIPLVIVYVLLLWWLYRKIQKPLQAAAEQVGWESGF